ncbi:DgyrCDS11158 [Dimorphilus gyrociliatus]|uniref:DgyrCDS11158 n=1 Tax=Dimorphilus gyrociliatus TaxID=2664684 RepID=A0A7I8W2H9_9ANNE|nr:DgyrCDS11158 [Dimorphilus gyrociliatus]
MIRFIEDEPDTSEELRTLEDLTIDELEEIYDYDEVSETNMDLGDEREVTYPINLERGVEGVFDLGEVIELLKAENMTNIACIRIPPEINYASYMVLTSAKSTRQIRAVSELFQILWKKKRSKRDRKFLRVEGKNTTDWYALDMGKEKYDLETLWTVGSHLEKDEELIKPDSFMSFLSGTSGNETSEPSNKTFGEEESRKIDLEGWDNPNWHNDKVP